MEEICSSSHQISWIIWYYGGATLEMLVEMKAEQIKIWFMMALQHPYSRWQGNSSKVLSTQDFLFMRGITMFQQFHSIENKINCPWNSLVVAPCLQRGQMLTSLYVIQSRFWPDIYIHIKPVKLFYNSDLFWSLKIYLLPSNDLVEKLLSRILMILIVCNMIIISTVIELISW